MNLFLIVGVLIVVVAAWFLVYYFANPVIEEPDGVAKVVGNCGDTMEISLKFSGDRVKDSQFWTNGCSYSRLCVEAAAMLAKKRDTAELRKINMTTIMDVVGDLPETHLHCAQLAEITLQRAVDDYLQPPEKKTPREPVAHPRRCG